MVPRRRNVMTTQTLRLSREPVLVPLQVLLNGPITALAAASPRRKVPIFGRRMSGPCGGRKEGPRGRNGSVHLGLGDISINKIYLYFLNAIWNYTISHISI